MFERFKVYDLHVRSFLKIHLAASNLAIFHK